MIHVIITTQDQAVCNAAELSDAAEDFCSAWAFDYYFRMYAVLLGDFDLTDYTENRAISFIFFTFTIMGVIILLNVLIAGMMAAGVVVSAVMNAQPASCIDSISHQ